MTSVVDGDSRLTMEYDLNQRLIRVDNEGTPGVRRTQLTNSWDANGNRIRVVDSDGVTVDSQYDARDQAVARIWLGQLASTDASALANIRPASTKMNYDSRGLMSSLQRFSDSAATQLLGTTNFQYDSLGRAGKILHQSAVDAVWADWDTQWDMAGQLSHWSVNGRVTRYQYDATGQLVSATDAANATIKESYQYDATGNRVATDFLVGPGNRLLSDDKYDYRYDAEGNLVARVERENRVKEEFEYDHANRMIGYRRTAPTGVLLASVEQRYDGLGRRISRRADLDGSGPIAATTESYVHDGDHVWLDADERGQVTARYLFGDRPDQLLARQRRGEDTVWYLADHLGSIRGLVDSEGNLIESIDYDSFGNFVREADTEVGDRYTFTGREWGEIEGLYHYRYRNYDPRTGRFTSEDPIGFQAGQHHLSAYVGNSPTSYVDPWGLMAIAEGAFTEQLRDRVERTMVAGAVGGSLGFACGFAETMLATGNASEALRSAARESVVGAVAGASLGYIGAANAVWSRYFTSIFGLTAAATYVSTSPDTGTLAIRSTCILVGLGFARATQVGFKATGAKSNPIRENILRNLSRSRSARESSNFEQHVRRETAYRFYRFLANWSPGRIMSHVEGIDFAKPVEIVEIPSGKILVQYIVSGRKIGNYFAEPGTSASQLGINPTGRETVRLIAMKPVIALKSTAREIDDTWTVPGTTYHASGGGTQFFVPTPGDFSGVR